jgi:hypothetical protein
MSRPTTISVTLTDTGHFTCGATWSHQRRIRGWSKLTQLCGPASRTVQARHRTNGQHEASLLDNLRSEDRPGYEL